MKKTTSLVVALMIGLVAVFTVSSQTVGTVPGAAADAEEPSSVENGSETPELHKASESVSGTHKDIESDKEDESETIDSDTIQLEE